MSVAFCVSVALVVGYVADLLFGEHFAAICPAILLGKLIAKLESPLRARAENDPAKLRRAGRMARDGRHTGGRPFVKMVQKPVCGGAFLCRA